MDVSGFIWEHWEKQQKIFSGNLSTLKNGAGRNSVHDLRVAVKKIRSYFKLYSELSGKKDYKENLAATEKLFSVLGKYRDLQVNLTLLTKLEKVYGGSYSAIKKFIRASLPEAQKRMNEALKKYSSKELETIAESLQKELLPFSQDELTEKIKVIFLTCIKQVRELIKDIKSQAHEVRKDLKNIFYWLSVFPPGSIISTAKLKSLDKILELLGDWHDHQMMLVNTKYYRKGFVPAKTGEYTKYKELEKELKKKNKASLDTTRDKIENWLKDISG